MRPKQSQLEITSPLRNDEGTAQILFLKKEKSMDKKKNSAFLKLMFCTACFSAASIYLISPVSSVENSEISAEPYLSEGDMRLFDGKMEDAQKMYEFILRENPNSYEALWRLSRYYVSSGMAVKKAKDKKKEWEKAKEFGRQAVASRPDGPEGHLYFAIAMGKLALYSSPAEKIKTVWDIKNEAEKTIELDPGEQKAYLVLGAWHRNVAVASSFEKKLAKMLFGKLPEGSLEESYKLLLKSIDLGGNEVSNYYELALTYEAMGNCKAAKEEYKNALSAKSIYPEDKEIKERIEKALSKPR